MPNTIRKALLTTSLFLVLLGGCDPGNETGGDVDLANFAIAYADAWSSGDPSALPAFYAVDGSLAVNGGTPSVGRAAIESTVESYMTAFPDMVVQLVEVTAVRQNAVFRWHWTGTNTGPDGTGNAVDLSGYEEWTLDADGLIAQSLGHYDEAEYQRQLNASNDEKDQL